jgi:hypothetical protein
MSHRWHRGWAPLRVSGLPERRLGHEARPRTSVVHNTRSPCIAFLLCSRRRGTSARRDAFIQGLWMQGTRDDGALRGGVPCVPLGTPARCICAASCARAGDPRTVAAVVLHRNIRPQRRGSPQSLVKLRSNYGQSVGQRCRGSAASSLATGTRAAPPSFHRRSFLYAVYTQGEGKSSASLYGGLKGLVTQEVAERKGLSRRYALCDKR